MKILKRHLNVPTVLSAMALFVALGGVTYAATAAKNSVKAKSIAKGAVTTPKIKNLAVTSGKIGNGAVISAKIGASAVGGTQIADGSVRSVELGGGVVTNPKIQNGAVNDAKLATNAVTSNKINAEAVTTGKLGNEAVTGAKMSSSILGQLVKNVTYTPAKSDEKHQHRRPGVCDGSLPDRQAGDRRRGPDPLEPGNEQSRVDPERARLRQWRQSHRLVRSGTTDRRRRRGRLGTRSSRGLRRTLGGSRRSPGGTRGPLRRAPRL